MNEMINDLLKQFQREANDHIKKYCEEKGLVSGDIVGYSEVFGNTRYAHKTTGDVLVTVKFMPFELILHKW